MRRHHRRQRAIAAAYGAVLEPARLRRHALRPDRRRAGGGVAGGRRHSYLMAMGRRYPLIVLLALAIAMPAIPGHARSDDDGIRIMTPEKGSAVSYTHLRAHETVLDIVCRLLLE